ncbi:MAG: hypothetical protein WA208_21545 [Thermoanaerobaculia bacterium]
MNSETLAVERYKADQLLKSTAGWFWWIGGLSIVNSALAGGGQQFTFTFGLGVSQLGDAFLAQKSPILSLLGFFMSYGFAGLFFLLAWLSRHAPVALPVGIAIYSLDTLLFLLFQDWLGLGFHLFALFLIGSGYVGYKKALAQLPTEPAQTTIGAPPPGEEARAV